MDEEFEEYDFDTLRYEESLAVQKRRRIITRLQEIEQAAKSSRNILTPGIERTLFALIAQLTQIIREELVE